MTARQTVSLPIIPADVRTIDATLARHRWRYNQETEFYETLPAPDCGPTIVDPMNVLAELPDYTDDEVTGYEDAKRDEWIRAGKPALCGVELPD